MPRSGSVYDFAWIRVRVKILLRDGYLCKIRGLRCTGEATEVDHIIPVSAGGARLDPTNLRASCRNCNRDARWVRPEVERRPSREW